MILLDACLNAPLTAISKRWPGMFHAAEMATIIDAWPSGTVTAVCGAKRLRLLQGDNQMPGLWPPATKGMLPGWTRCRDCWVATGKKRPRSKWVPKSAQRDGPEPVGLVPPADPGQPTQYDGDVSGNADVPKPHGYDGHPAL